MTSPSSINVLAITPLQEDLFLLVDTRGLPGSMEFEFIDTRQAAIALVGQVRDFDERTVAWARERGVAVELDRKIVPLATAEAWLIDRFESVARNPDATASVVPEKVTALVPVADASVK